MPKNTSTPASRGPFQLVDNVPVGRIFLALDNPRHEPVEDEAQAIERLCAKESILPLARDIARHGLSPLERFALSPIGKPSSGQTYYVNEGNRRFCALKLLADPDLAPPKLRKAFEKLASTWTPIRAVSAAVFTDADTMRIWLDRTHSGPQGGVGRKTWDAEQKQRFFGSNKNRVAQSLLDYAEAEGMITKEERTGKLTTAQRFLGPDIFREAIGIDPTTPDDLGRTRPKAEFDTMVRRFMRDLVEGKEVNSRKNKSDIVQYARTLTGLPGVSNRRIEAEPLRGPADPAKKSKVRRLPKKPEKARHVRFEEEISQALKSLGNEKLQSLYYSICDLELDKHTPLVCIGAWAFFETLTACQGRNESTSFPSFLSKAKLTTLGVTGSTTTLQSAIGRIHEYGNSTKHHKLAAAFNGDQLNNDMIALKELILKCIAEAKP